MESHKLLKINACNFKAKSPIGAIICMFLQPDEHINRLFVHLTYEIPECSVQCDTHSQVSAHTAGRERNRDSNCFSLVGCERQDSHIKIPLLPPFSLLQHHLAMIPQVAAARAEGRKLIWPQIFLSYPWERGKKRVGA